jgi:hypothetical protein
MMDRIMVHIIERHPKMAFGFHRSFEKVVPNLAPATIISTVPLKRESAMELAHCASEFLDTLSLQEQVIMIRKYAPGMNGCGKFGAASENFGLAFSHPFRMLANHARVLVTRRGN